MYCWALSHLLVEVGKEVEKNLDAGVGRVDPRRSTSSTWLGFAQLRGGVDARTAVVNASTPESLAGAYRESKVAS